MAGNERIKIDYEKIYDSNSFGKFKIIKDLGRDERSRLYIRIKFLDTGSEKDVRYDIAIDGKVRDDLYGIDFNKLYHSIYYGDFRILRFIGRNDDHRKLVRIKFINTGYEYDVLLKQVLNGDVKDYSVNFENRKISSVNYNTSEYDSIIRYILFGRWKAMMSRCYNPNDCRYSKYGYLGVKVDKLWHDFETYLITVKLIRNYDKFYHNPSKYQLDKDLKQLDIPMSQRVYSTATCTFLCIADNANLAIMENHAGYYGIRQSGENYEIIFSIKGKKFQFGVYSNLDAALSMYDFYYKRCADFELVPLLNSGFKLMSVEEAELYKIK